MSDQQPVHVQVTVVTAEDANASVNISVAATPEPNIHVNVLSTGEATVSKTLRIQTPEDGKLVRTYNTGPGSTLIDEFDIIADDQPKRTADISVPEEHPFKLRRTKTLEIPDDDPKNEYEYYQVRKSDPSERDPLWFPVITRYPKKNSWANLWVKMDTGADINLVSMGTIVDLGQVDQIKPWSPVDGKDIEEIGGNKFAICGSVTLSFVAGFQKRPFTAEFLIPTDREGIDTNTDGLPNVLVGWRFLLQNHLLMVDFDYHNDEDEQYETLALHAWDEREKAVLKACPLIRPNAPGASGHGTRGGSVKVRPNAAGFVR